MAKLHMKGYIMRLLNNHSEGLWDYQVAEEVMKGYGVHGGYWRGTVRLTLTDLYSCGLIEEIEDALDDGTRFGKDKILMRYTLTQFGRERMNEALIA